MVSVDGGCGIALVLENGRARNGKKMTYRRRRCMVFSETVVQPHFNEMGKEKEKIQNWFLKMKISRSKLVIH